MPDYSLGQFGMCFLKQSIEEVLRLTLHLQSFSDYFALCAKLARSDEIYNLRPLLLWNSETFYANKNCGIFLQLKDKQHGYKFSWSQTISSHTIHRPFSRVNKLLRCCPTLTSADSDLMWQMVS